MRDRAWTGCPDRRQSVSAAHALTDWQGNTDTARCTALVQRVGAARALTTDRQYAHAFQLTDAVCFCILLVSD